MPTPSTGSLGLSGSQPRVGINYRRTPVVGVLGFSGKHPTASIAVFSLGKREPYMLPTLTDTRKIIRATTEVVRDIVYNTKLTEITLSLDLNGGVFDADSITSMDCAYRSADGLYSGAFDTASDPLAFDFTRTEVVRGIAVGVITLVLSPTTIAKYFNIGLWYVDVFLYDAVNTNGALWGTLELDVRSVYPESFLSIASTTLSMTSYVPTVIYRNLTPAAAELSIGGNQPVVTRQGSGSPAAGALSIGGNAPVISQSMIKPSAGGLTIGGQAAIRTP